MPELSVTASRVSITRTAANSVPGARSVCTSTDSVAPDAHAVSSDGTTVLGTCYALVSEQHFVWTAQDGMVSIEDLLADIDQAFEAVE